jgi:hypothetical protein
MKRLAFAAALLAVAAAAPAAEVPKPRCEPVPKMPGRTMWQEKSVRRDFERDLKAYKDCMTAYLDERNAAIKANQDAANTAINEFNGVMKALNEAQGEK